MTGLHPVGQGGGAGRLLLLLPALQLTVLHPPPRHQGGQGGHSLQQPAEPLTGSVTVGPPTALPPHQNTPSAAVSDGSDGGEGGLVVVVLQTGVQTGVPAQLPPDVLHSGRGETAGDRTGQLVLPGGGQPGAVRLLLALLLLNAAGYLVIVHPLKFKSLISFNLFTAHFLAGRSSCLNE